MILCAAVANDKEELAPHTCRSTVSEVKAVMNQDANWEVLKYLGATIKKTVLMTVEEMEEKEESHKKALALINEMAISMMEDGQGKFRDPTPSEKTNWARRAKEFLKEFDGK